MNIKVFTQYKDLVNSYPLGEQTVGILKPGRYSGFNYITGTTLNIRLKHGLTIMKSSPSNQGQITRTVFGSLLMPTGCTVHVEDTTPNEGIALVVDNNIGNTYPRYDLVIAEHEYVNNQGGQQPIIFVQKGPALGVLPTVANPEKQVVIGTIKILPNGSSFLSLEYFKSPVPTLGDEKFDELVFRFGLAPLFNEKADKTALALTNQRVLVLENDTRVTEIREDLNYLEAVTIEALEQRITTLENKPDNTLKTHVTYLPSWTKNRKYTISHEIPTPTDIMSCNVQLLCVATDAGYVTGDILQAPTRGEDQDGNSDYNYGISVQHRATGSNQCTITIGSRLKIAGGPTDSSTNSNMYEIDAAKWAIRLVWVYR